MTTPDFVPKQMRPYRVPTAFRADVNCQIRELSDKGPVHPSVSPMARALFRSTTRAIVRVVMKSGGVRMAGNFRYLNILAVGDAHPRTTVKETLCEIVLRTFVSPCIT